MSDERKSGARAYYTVELMAEFEVEAGSLAEAVAEARAALDAGGAVDGEVTVYDFDEAVRHGSTFDVTLGTVRCHVPRTSEGD